MYRWQHQRYHMVAVPGVKDVPSSPGVKDVPSGQTQIVGLTPAPQGFWSEFNKAFRIRSLKDCNCGSGNAATVTTKQHTMANLLMVRVAFLVCPEESKEV